MEGAPAAVRRGGGAPGGWRWRRFGGARDCCYRTPALVTPLWVMAASGTMVGRDLRRAAASRVCCHAGWLGWLAGWVTALAARTSRRQPPLCQWCGRRRHPRAHAWEACACAFAWVLPLPVDPSERQWRRWRQWRRPCGTPVRFTWPPPPVGRRWSAFCSEEVWRHGDARQRGGAADGAGCASRRCAGRGVPAASSVGYDKAVLDLVPPLLFFAVDQSEPLPIEHGIWHHAKRGPPPYLVLAFGGFLQRGSDGVDRSIVSVPRPSGVSERSAAERLGNLPATPPPPCRTTLHPVRGVAASPPCPTPPRPP